MPGMNALISLLDDFTQVPGLSGHEDAIARALAGYLAPLADALTIDPLGNVSARFGPPDGSPHLAVLAHMDTVGLLVKWIDTSSGVLGVVPVGGINWRALPGAAVRVGDGVPGVISIRSQHLARPHEPPPDADSITIQIDPSAAQEITVTTPITFAPQAIRLGASLYAAPGLDNRAGCAVLVALAQRLAESSPGCTVTLIGTVQEETTCAGAAHALRLAAPDATIFVDGTLSYDTPDVSTRGSVFLGGGPVLTAYLYVSGLNGWHAHPALRAHLVRTATAAGLPVQQDAVRGLMSDARTAAALGIPSALIGFPLRGKHGPLETLHLHDLTHTLELLDSALRQPLPDLSRGP
jgi:putative aminopeptidase FrvX